MKTLTKPQKRFDLIFITLLFITCIYLSFDLLYKDGKPTTPGIFYSDRSQYYIYLPATFIYNWNPNLLPPRVDTLYAGFPLLSKNQKLAIKMTCGVAILATPFFLATHTIALISGLPANGFSDIYEKMGLVVPIFYLILGLFFLKRFLDNYFRYYISWITVLFVFLGTNLYYYGLVEGWMSHVFSFFLFSLYLYLLKGFIDGGKRRYFLFLLIAFVVSLAALVRPTNIVLLLALGLLDVRTFREVMERLRFFLHPKYLISFVIISLLVFTPQFLYWHYRSGSFLFYSYGNESFLYWKNPMLIRVWFAQLNGLFIYNPLVLFMIAGIILMVWRKVTNGWFLALLFLLISYLTASWHMWYFGGSYGCRNMIEYYAFFSLSFAYFLSSVLKIHNLFLKSLLIFAISLCTLYNQRMIYNPRWNTASTWAWDDFKEYLNDKDILHFSKETYTLIKDFENVSLNPSEQGTTVKVHSPTYACMLYPSYLFGCGYTRNMKIFLDKPVERITASCWVDSFESDDCGASMVCAIVHQKAGTVLFRNVPFIGFGTRKGEWVKISTEMDIPYWINDPEYEFQFYIWNTSKKQMIIDDIKIRFE